MGVLKVLEELRVPNPLHLADRHGGAYASGSQSAAQITDISLLPIPFSAVAADIATGEEVVMSEGSLAQALSASMYS